jgi:hypothetical protein
MVLCPCRPLQAVFVTCSCNELCLSVPEPWACNPATFDAHVFDHCPSATVALWPDYVTFYMGRDTVSQMWYLRYHNAANKITGTRFETQVGIGAQGHEENRQASARARALAVPKHPYYCESTGASENTLFAICPSSLLPVAMSIGWEFQQ